MTTTWNIDNLIAMSTLPGQMAVAQATQEANLAMAKATTMMAVVTVAQAKRANVTEAEYQAAKKELGLTDDPI